MPMSPYVRNRLLIGAGVVLSVIGILQIPPAEKYADIKTDRPWAKIFRDTLFDVDAADEHETAQISKDLCAGIMSEVKSGVTLKQGMDSIDTAMAQIGAHISEPPAYINKGYITYYFTPTDPSLPLSGNYEKTLHVFAAESLGPRYSWLNPKWHQAHRTANVEGLQKKYIRMEDPYISMSFETPFPLADEYTKNDLLKTPPRHIDMPAKYASLRFEKSERRDMFAYTYSIDMRNWHQKLFGGERYYNVDFQISARRNKDGTLDDLRITPSCKYPAKGVLYTSPGVPPAGGDATLRAPMILPSCPEYLQWFKCQHGDKGAVCEGVTETAPSCPAENPDFPKADYPQPG